MMFVSVVSIDHSEAAALLKYQVVAGFFVLVISENNDVGTFCG